MHRAPTERLRRLAEAFADWGLPTAESLQSVRAVRDEMGLAASVALFASGGVRNGQEIAKCLALGADLVGLAGPFLKKAVQGAEAVIEEMEILETELRIAMFCSGARTPLELRRPGVLLPIG